MRDAHPRLCRKEGVDLTPVVVDRSARQSAATDNLAAHAVVRDPLVDAVEAPRVAHELRPLLRLPEARLLVVVPIRHLVVVMDKPQVRSVGGADRLKPQAHREPGVTGIGQWRAFHPAQRPTTVTMLQLKAAGGDAAAVRGALVPGGAGRDTGGRGR